MKKVLLIDDELEIVELLKMRLEANDYTVVAAFDGTQGLEKAKKEKPDLIILDVGMPKMDGFTFVRELKKIADVKSTPVIVLTARDKMEDIFKLEGVSHYLAKPFNADELLQKVKEMLGK